VKTADLNKEKKILEIFSTPFNAELKVNRMVPNYQVEINITYKKEVTAIKRVICIW